MRRTFRRPSAIVWVASTSRICVVPIPKAIAPNAPCVLVCESPQAIVVPGCVMPCSGPTMCTMPCLPVARSKKVMPVSAQFFRSASIIAWASGSR